MRKECKKRERRRSIDPSRLCMCLCLCSSLCLCFGCTFSWVCIEGTALFTFLWSMVSRKCAREDDSPCLIPSIPPFPLTPTSFLPVSRLDSLSSPTPQPSFPPSPVLADRLHTALSLRMIIVVVTGPQFSPVQPPLFSSSLPFPSLPFFFPFFLSSPWSHNALFSLHSINNNNKKQHHQDGTSWHTPKKSRLNLSLGPSMSIPCPYHTMPCPYHAMPCHAMPARAMVQPPCLGCLALAFFITAHLHASRILGNRRAPHTNNTNW